MLEHTSSDYNYLVKIKNIEVEESEIGDSISQHYVLN